MHNLKNPKFLFYDVTTNVYSVTEIIGIFMNDNQAL